MYTLYFSVPVSDGSFAVMAEDYCSIADSEPVVGSERVVSGNHTKGEARRKAAALQRSSYSTNRQEKANG